MSSDTDSLRAHFASGELDYDPARPEPAVPTDGELCEMAAAAGF